MNGDGKPDLVTANAGSDNVSVLLGNGDGTFRAQATFAAGQGAKSLAIAELNGDGTPDLIVANNGTMSVLLGNGDGTFQSQMSFLTVGSSVTSVAAADINGDGKPDLILANYNTFSAPFQLGSTLSVLLGNGDGTFQTETTLATGKSPICVVTADVNGDQKLDLIVANGSSDSISILLGNGNGTFQQQLTFATGHVPRTVGVADVSGDGKPDLVVANLTGYNVGVLLGNGNGTFQNQTTFAPGQRPAAVTVSDINGDGKPDLAVAHLFTNDVGVLLGNGNGTFQNQTTFTTGSRPACVTTADLNGDGRPDVITANQSNDNDVSMLLNNTSADVTGQTYAVVPLLDTITGTTGVDQITLTQDLDQAHVDWTSGATSGQMSINDPYGLTINGNGSNDVITLDNSHGNPLPNSMRLNGIFALNKLAATGNPLAGTMIDLMKSTLFISYSAPANDPVNTIRGYLQTGDNAGLWIGVSANGSIRSSSAASDATHTSAIGYADSKDGLVTLPVNTLELKYTLYGDTGLTTTVGFTDFMRMTQHFTQATDAMWGKGDFNYDGAVDAGDFALLQPNYGKTLPAPAQVPVVIAPPAPVRPPRTVVTPPPAAPVIDPTPATIVAAVPEPVGKKHPKAKRHARQHG